MRSRQLRMSREIEPAILAALPLSPRHIALQSNRMLRGLNNSINPCPNEQRTPFVGYRGKSYGIDMHLIAPSFYEFVQGSEKSHLYAPPTQVADVCCTIMTGAVFKSLVEGSSFTFCACILQRAQVSHPLHIIYLAESIV